MRLTPHKPVSRRLPHLHIRSSKSRWDLSTPCLLIGALQRRRRRPGLGYDLLRWELAITGLDCLLDPCPEFGDRIARQDPYGPPAGFRPPSSYSGHDRPVSSHIATIKGPFRPLSTPYKMATKCRFPFASRLQTFRLTVTINSLARVSRRNISPWDYHIPRIFFLAEKWLREDVPFRRYTSVTIWLQTLFTPLSGSFSAFLHSTIALSVLGSI